MRRISTRTRRGEGGQAASEYMGVLSLVAAIFLVLVVTGIAGTLATALEAAICRILGGSCTPASVLAKPPGPCNVKVHSAEATGGVTVFSVDLGARGKWTTTKLSDDTYKVSVEGGGNIGAKFGHGAGATISLGGKGPKGGGKQYELSVGLTGSAGHSWSFANEAEAQEFFRAATRAPIKEAATNWLGPLQGVGMWALDKADGYSWDPSDPNESFYEGGRYLAGKVTGKAGSLGGSAEAKTTQVLGVKVVEKGPLDGTKTVYFKVSGEVGVSGSGALSGTPLSFNAEGKLAGEAVVSITYDPQGQPKEMKLETAGQFEASQGLGAALEGKDAKAILSSLKKVGASGSSPVGKKGVVTLSMDLTDPTNRDAAADLMHSFGVPVLDGDGTPDPSFRDSLSTVYDRFNDPNGRTHLSVTTYDTSSNKFGAEAVAGKVVEFGLSGDLTFKDEQISSASYYVPGQGMVVWKECAIK